MRKKISFAFAAILTVAALQWAVASVDTQPATQQVVSGKTAQSTDAKACPETASCPKGSATCDKAASASCPKTEGATCDKASDASCPKGAAAKTTTTSTEAVDCTKADGAKCPYSSGTTTKS